MKGKCYKERRKENLELNIIKNDDTHTIRINKMDIPNVKTYKIATSSSGETEIELKLKLDVNASFIDMYTST